MHACTAFTQLHLEHSLQYLWGKNKKSSKTFQTLNNARFIKRYGLLPPCLGGQRSDLDSFESSLPSHKIRKRLFAIFPLFKPNLTLQTADQTLPHPRSTVRGKAWFPTLHDKGQLLFLQATDGSLEKSLPIHSPLANCPIILFPQQNSLVPLESTFSTSSLCPGSLRSLGDLPTLSSAPLSPCHPCLPLS